MLTSILPDVLYTMSSFHFAWKEHQIFPGLCELWRSVGATSLWRFFQPLIVFFSHTLRSLLRQTKSKSFLFSCGHLFPLVAQKLYSGYKLKEVPFLLIFLLWDIKILHCLLCNVWKLSFHIFYFVLYLLTEEEQYL